MWLKQLVLTLSLVSTVMSFGVELIDNTEIIEIEEEIVIKEEIINEEEIAREVEVIEITKFDVNGLILKEGIANEEVKRVKRFFREIGYDIGDDYYFDSETKETVIQYQTKSGLTADGAIGANTFDKINEDMELKGINIPEIQLIFTKEIPENQWIVINKSNNTLYHLTGENLISKYPVATGKLPQYTPEGKFTIVSKLINPAWGGAGRHTPVKGGAPNNPLGKRWMGLSIKGGGVYGIHGNSAKDSIGRYISLGCVRMFNEDVEYLFDLIENGTPVWIGGEEVLEEYGVVFEISHQWE